VTSCDNSPEMAVPDPARHDQAGHAVPPSGGGSNVPKKVLVSTLQVLLQARRIKAARALPDAALLVKEVQNFKVKVTDSGKETFEAWREGDHDDLVMAVALAARAGERMRTGEHKIRTRWTKKTGTAVFSLTCGPDQPAVRCVRSIRPTRATFRPSVRWIAFRRFVVGRPRFFRLVIRRRHLVGVVVPSQLTFFGN
jgi:hypothetical protein